MRLLSILEEALKPSQYRPYVKSWDKTRWADLFGGKYRIYLPLVSDTGSSKPITVNPKVAAALQSAGYQVSDYVKGLAVKSSDPRKQQVRIGKILADTRLGITPDVVQAFNQDPARQAVKASESDQLVVISRHPYDIAGMSTDRGWTSCMNLRGGINRRYVKLDIKQGTIVAYLIDKDDVNIKRPKARIAIKPFVNVENKKQIALGVESKVVKYGTAPDSFPATVVAWADKVNASNALAGVFELDSKLYRDGAIMQLVGPSSTSAEDIILKRIQKGDTRLSDVPVNLRTEKVCLAAVGKYWAELKYVPTELKTQELCSMSVNWSGMALEFVPDKLKTPEICLAAVNKSGSALRFIPDNLNTPEICLAAVRGDGTALRYVSDNLKTREMCLTAVNKNGVALEFVPDKLKTPEICLAAVNNYPLALEHTPDKFKTQEMCLAAVENNSRLLKFVPDHLKTQKMCLNAALMDIKLLQYVPDRFKTQEICLAAVGRDGNVLKYVPDKFKTRELCSVAVKEAGRSALAFVPTNMRIALKRLLKNFL